MFKLPSLFNKERSLTIGTLVFIALIGVSLAGLAAWGSWQEYRKQFRDAEITTSNMARALAQHAEDALVSVDNIVAGLVNTVELQNRHHLPNAELHQFLLERVADYPMLHGLFVMDQTGRAVVSSQPWMARGLMYDDREYFKYHRHFTNRSAHIGPAVYSKSTGDWVLTVSRRLNHEDGSFAGVVVATIKLDYFKFFYDEFDIGDDGVILLASDNGKLLMRRPSLESAVGMDISGGTIISAYRSEGPVGTMMLKSMVDHTERLYSYRHFDDYPLLVAVALSKEEIFAAWRTQTYRLIAICTILFILLGIFGSYLILQIRIRQATENELRDAKLTLESLNDELQALASEDSLTGLCNRRKFDATLTLEFVRAVRNHSSLALIMIDVDRFKQFNDQYGHVAGDECLKRIADVLKNIPGRASDMAARYGGEELAVLLPETDVVGAHTIAERIRAEIEALAIPHAANFGGVVTVSAGVSAFRPTLHNGNARMLVQEADEALYDAKAQGRNCVRIAEP
ncbi:MAG TPA: sensor domain-containing diguanylate cyclase [Oxalicibacterium sp.]|nr:sensor domain-containing diguanylate cyclase [Oxalicibacterium sp.]